LWSVIVRHSFATFACFFFCLVGTAFSIDAPRVVAHRGLLKHAPENTLANFRSCLTLRVGFEVDVQRAQDGTLVCIHDDTVDRTTDGRGRVAELSLRQLKELDAGSWFGTDFKSEPIPTFSEVAQLITASRPPSLIAVDLEAPGIEEDVVAEARQAGVLDRIFLLDRQFVTEQCVEVFGMLTRQFTSPVSPMTLRSWTGLSTMRILTGSTSGTFRPARKLRRSGPPVSNPSSPVRRLRARNQSIGGGQSILNSMPC
jgi:hypothetical protein